MADFITEPSLEAIDVATVLSALADPVRLAYVQALARAGDAAVCGQVLSATDLSVSKSTLSHHLKILRAAGLTHTRVEGTRRFVSLRRDEIERRFPGLLAIVTDNLNVPA